MSGTRQTPLLHWRPAFSVGVEAIDNDHRRLVHLMNSLHFRVLAGDDRVGIGEALAELISFAKSHFAREEAMMAASDYPLRQAHAASHDEIARTLEEYRAAFVADPDGFDGDGLYDFFADWLVSHMCDEDRVLGAHVARWLRARDRERNLREKNLEARADRTDRPAATV